MNYLVMLVLFLNAFHYNCLSMETRTCCEGADIAIKGTKMSDTLCVTSGASYTDIDALACAVAFAELNNCVAVLPGAFNATIPDSVKKWDYSTLTEFPKPFEQFVIVDVSNPEYLPHHITQDKIIKVFDHHVGFESYWGDKGKIEFVGACATLIFELFEFEDVKPSPTTANLLYTAIFANTLNFNASITTERDIAAFEKLKSFISLPNDWIRQYYSEVESGMLSDFASAIKNDTKVISSNGWAIAQIELYDAAEMLKNQDFLTSLNLCMKDYSDWLLTMPSISEGKNYLITNSQKIKDILSQKINAKWSGSVGQTDKLYLRKEILKIIGMK